MITTIKPKTYPSSFNVRFFDFDPFSPNVFIKRALEAFKIIFSTTMTLLLWTPGKRKREREREREQRTTNNEQRTTNNKQRTTNNRQQTKERG
jgi:hypothetical protein